jgi:glycosyltransferase involved in cell wall biosynthesis
MNRADIVVTLPFPVEGFYLPALEAMAMGKALVCPDCIGNRSFCQHEINCLMPAFQLDSIEAAVLRLLSAPDLTRKLKERAFSDSQTYNIERERTQFSQILLSCDV